MLQDPLSKPLTTASVDSKASQILTQALHLMRVSDLRYELYSIQFYREELIKVEGENMQNSGQSTWTNTYAGPRYSTGQAMGHWDSSAPHLSSAWAAGCIHLPASAFTAPGLLSKNLSESFRAQQARSPQGRPRLHIPNRPGEAAHPQPLFASSHPPWPGLTHSSTAALGSCRVYLTLYTTTQVSKICLKSLTV